MRKCREEEGIKPFNISVCAETDAKIERCIQQTDKDEKSSLREIEREMWSINKLRS